MPHPRSPQPHPHHPEYGPGDGCQNGANKSTTRNEATATAELHRLAELVRDTVLRRPPWADPFDNGELISQILHTCHPDFAHFLAKVYDQPHTPAKVRRPSVLQALRGESERLPYEQPFEIEVEGLNDPDTPRFFAQAIFGIGVECTDALLPRREALAALLLHGFDALHTIALVVLSGHEDTHLAASAIQTLKVTTTDENLIWRLSQKFILRFGFERL